MTPPLRAWILSDGKIGDEVPCFGLTQALGWRAERRLIAPRKLFAACAPYGPIDWKDRPLALGSPLAPPFPDVALASGRRTIPYLRYLRRCARERTYTIFLKNPRIDCRFAHLVWAPAHDGLKSPNVLSSLITPHPITPDLLVKERMALDARLTALPSPRVACLIGGPTRHRHYTLQDSARLIQTLQDLRAFGASLMITASRRTPSHLKSALRYWAQGKEGKEEKEGVFFWDETGANPYLSMLASADALLVTMDSVNMIGEALAVGAPVYVWEPSGGHPREKLFLEPLLMSGAVRLWRGELLYGEQEPLNETPSLAREIAHRYAHWIKYRQETEIFAPMGSAF